MSEQTRPSGYYYVTLDCSNGIAYYDSNSGKWAVCGVVPYFVDSQLDYIGLPVPTHLQWMEAKEIMGNVFNGSIEPKHQLYSQIEHEINHIFESGANPMRVIECVRLMFELRMPQTTKGGGIYDAIQSAPIPFDWDVYKMGGWQVVTRVGDKVDVSIDYADEYYPLSGGLRSVTEYWTLQGKYKRLMTGNHKLDLLMYKINSDATKGNKG